MKLAFGKGIGNKFIGTVAQELVQRSGRHIFGDEDDIDALGFGGFYDLAEEYSFVFVLGIKRHSDKFKRLCFGLFKEMTGFCESDIAPSLTEGALHVFDKKIEVLNITTHRDGLERGKLLECFIRMCHCLIPHI